MDEATRAILDGQQKQLDKMEQVVSEINVSLKGINETLNQLTHHEYRLDAHDAEIKDHKREMDKIDDRLSKLEGYKWILAILSAVIIGGAVTMVNMSIKMSMTAGQNKPISQEQFKQSIIEAIKETRSDNP